MKHNYLISSVICGFLLIAGTPSRAAEPDSGTWEGLREMMSAEEFRAAGLDKLSDRELEALDRWMLEFLAHDSAAVVATDETIREMQREPVKRRIAGHFGGWSGKTMFTLENGEVWRQRMSGRYKISLENPEVEIYRNWLGLWEMKVVETGRKVGVARVK